VPNTNQNPLKDYIDPTTVPDMTVDGLTVNKSFAYTGVVDTLNTNRGSLVAPQSTKRQPGPTTKLPQSTGNNFSTYWTSPTDVIGSKSITAVQFQLKNPSSSDITIFNYIAFELLDVPANWFLWYQDSTTGAMRQATDVNGNFVGGRTTGSTGRWIHLETFLQPLGTSFLELRFDRNVPITSQTGNYVTGTQYSLELRNLDLKMIATRWNDVPSSSRVAAVNVLGFTELYAKRQNDSSQIQTPTVRTSNLNPSSYWKSRIQPYGDSVVSLYVDLGSIQTVDSIYLDPLYTGMSCNIYSSTDTTVNTEFYCSRKMGTFTQKDPNNPVTFYFNGPQAFVPNVPGQTGMSVGVASSSSYTNMGLTTPPNIQIDGSRSWSMGISFTPKDSTSASGTLVDQYVSSSSSHSTTLSYSTGTTYITFTAVVNGTTLSTSSLSAKVPKVLAPFNNFPYTLVWGYDATTSQVFLYVDNKTNTTYSVIGAATNTTLITDTGTSFTIGNNANGGSPANGYLTDFWIKQDAPVPTSSPVPSIISKYINSTRSFINAPGPATTSRGDYRSLLMSTLNSANVFYGPNSDYFASKQWTNVQNNLPVRSGTYHINQFTGRYVKIDFMNLSAQVYPVMHDYQKTTKTMPVDVVQGFVKREQQIPNTTTPNGYLGLNTTGGATNNLNTQGPASTVLQTPAGIVTQQFLSGTTQADLNAVQLGTQPSRSVSNNNSIIVDPTSNSNYINFLNGAPGITDDVAVTQTTLASFVPVGTHEYQTKTVTQSWNQGYFAGLKAIGFYKTNPVATDDTEFYLDTCTVPASSLGTNGSIFASTTFTQPTSSSAGFTASDVGNTLTTQALSSFSPVTSFQLSAITSDWAPFTPWDQATMLNNLPSSYLTFTNCSTPTQVSSFVLTTGVWAFTQTTVNDVSNSHPTCGPKTVTTTIPGTRTGGMRCSAAARIYLPNTNTGQYVINLYATIGGTTSVVASKVYSKVPLQNFTDLQVGWSVPLGSTVTNLQAEVLQINTSIYETFYLSMLAPFVHPIGWFSSIDGSTYYPISSRIGDPNTYVSFGTPTNSFYIKAISYTTNAYINAVMVKPQYTQNAYTPSASLNYFPDPRTNEIPARVSVYDHPMFKMNTNLYPASLLLGSVSQT